MTSEPLVPSSTTQERPMYVCPECVSEHPYSCGGPHLNGRKKQRRYEFFDTVRVVPAEVTDEMVERAWRAYYGLADDESPSPGASMAGFRAALAAALSTEAPDA